MCSQSAQGFPPEKRSRRAQPVVVVDHVSMIFNMASERIGSLKEYAIKAVRRELMFKEFKALDDVSFTVERGDVFGLMGTNGSGKSTMLKIIAGVLEPSLGTCEVNGVIAPLIELGAGFDMELSARENIYLNGALLGYSKQFMEEHFDNIVEFADVEGFLDMPMKNYSSGMVARIAFAIATEVIPDILIVDEVLSVGDFMFQQKCERRIRSLIEDHGVTVLIVSHDSDLVERLCNKAIWIEKGHEKALGEAAEVCALYRLLGGHEGSVEATAKVQQIFESPVEASQRLSTSFFAESRYGSAVQFAEAAFADSVPEAAILAPGDSEPVCLVANGLAGLMEAPVLLYEANGIPDATLRYLQEVRPSEVIVFESINQSATHFKEYLEEDLVDVLPDCALSRISGFDLSEISLNAYRFGAAKHSWAHAALITHQFCSADHIALYAYAYEHKIPAFFIKANQVIDQGVKEILASGSIDELLVVSGEECISEECLEFVEGHIEQRTRFCFEGGYEASIRIAEWLVEQDPAFSLKAPIISSLLVPTYAYGIGPYAATTGRVVLMEDPQNLDSVVKVYDFLKENRELVDQLVFIGDSKTFSKVDRMILTKALVS